LRTWGNPSRTSRALTGFNRKGQRSTLLSHHANLTLAGRRSLRKLLRANKRLAIAYLLKEEFGQLWAYRRAGWARQFFYPLAGAI
jgi:transposase